MGIATDIKQKNKRYLPHELTTKIHSVKLYRQTKDIGFVLHRYHISKTSLMRWNRLYDSTTESLMPKLHRPHNQHPNAHTEEELTWILSYHRRNPNISICELYGKLRQEKAYSRHPLLIVSCVRLDRILQKGRVYQEKIQAPGAL